MKCRLCNASEAEWLLDDVNYCLQCFAKIMGEMAENEYGATPDPQKEVEEVEEQEKEDKFINLLQEELDYLEENFGVNDCCSKRTRKALVNFKEIFEMGE